MNDGIVTSISGSPDSTSTTATFTYDRINAEYVAQWDRENCDLLRRIIQAVESNDYLRAQLKIALEGRV